jgi:hypothetical protein
MTPIWPIVLSPSWSCCSCFPGAVLPVLSSVFECTCDNWGVQRSHKHREGKAMGSLDTGFGNIELQNQCALVLVNFSQGQSYLHNVYYRKVKGACRASYLGGRDQEDGGLRPAQAERNQDLMSTSKLGVVRRLCNPSHSVGISRRTVVCGQLGKNTRPYQRK